MKHKNNEEFLPDSNLQFAFFLNLIFTIVEFIGGYLTNSVAIIADSLHDLGDTMSLGLSLILEKYSKKGRSVRFSYGYKRFSLLAALINSLILIIGSIFVLYKTIPRLIKPIPSNYTGMLVLALLGIIVNGIAVLRLNKAKTMNEKVVSWHFKEDVFGWVAVLVVSLVNMIYELPILDPILAIILTLIVGYNVFKNLKTVLMVFLQSVPSELSIDKLDAEFNSVKGVSSVHDTHIWSLDSHHHILTTHIVLQKKYSLHKVGKIKCKVKETAHLFGIHHSTVEIEQKNETCDYQKC